MSVLVEPGKQEQQGLVLYLEVVVEPSGVKAFCTKVLREVRLGRRAVVGTEITELRVRVDKHDHSNTTPAMGQAPDARK